MKKFLALLVVLGLAIAAAQDVDALDPSGQEIVFWHQHTNERVDALDQIVAEFNATNPWGITVTHEYQGGYGDIFQKMLPILGTSSAPNLVVAYQNQAATYAIGDGMVDLTPYVNSAEYGLTDGEKADFFPGFYSADVFPSFDSQRFGFPPNRSMEVMYYNAEWLAELAAAGAISFDGPPTTPEQFREAACAAVETPFSKATGGRSLGYQLSTDASRFASWTFAFGGNVYDYDADRYTYDAPAAVEAMSFLQGLFDDGCADFVVERYGDQTDFGAGNLLFTVGSSSGLPFYQSAVDEGAAFAWSVAPIPHVTDEPVMNIYGASVSVPTGHSDEANLAAWLFLKHYTSPESQALWATSSNYFPVRQSVATEMSDYFAANEAYGTAFDLLPYGQAEPPVPGYDFVRDMIEAEMAAIMDGADVEETLALATGEANLILDDQLSAMQ